MINMIIMVLIEKAFIKILKLNMILMVLINIVIMFMIIEKKTSKSKTSEAKSFEDQKGKGYIDLPIALSKIYTNNSSKELINNIEQLINDLYDNKQITKQVYNNLIKAITYK